VILCFACVDTLCALELVHQSDVLYCSVLQCYASLRVLRELVHWNWCIKATCSTVACCNSIVLRKSVCADRSGMAAPRLLERYLCSSVESCDFDCVLQAPVVNRIVVAA
jgi:hypothetical protein